MLQPWPLRRFDLVHGWNRVPLGPTPFVVGFEWHIPLTWENTPRSLNLLLDVLASDRCRGLVAASQAAATITEHRHVNDPRRDALMRKMTVRLPNVEIPDMADWFDPSRGIETLRLVFVGDQFGAKGGCVAVKLAERARAAGLPLHITIVSSLQRNNMDPERVEFLAPYRKLIDQPNITHVQAMDYDQVLDLIANAHLTLIPTLSDCYSMIGMEGMARFTPMITTATGAFPEFIDETSGLLLKVETTCQGEWRHSEHFIDRTTPGYEQLFADTVDRLADQALAVCTTLINDPAKLGGLRAGARRMAQEKLSAEDAARFWDDFYVAALDRR